MAHEVRHSHALEAEIISDPVLLAQTEVQNGLKQFEAVVKMVESFLDPERPFKFRPSHLQHLHRVALMGLSGYPDTGVLRASRVRAAGIRLPIRS